MIVYHNRYKLIRVLGKGGMGNVYLVQDLKLQHVWAMKQLHEKASLIMRQSFMKEIDILSQLKYYAFPRIVDRFEEDGTLYVVMDYIEGISLLEAMQINMNNDELFVQWMQELCDHLSYLHHQKPYPLIYLDLKPQNIIIDHHNHVHLLDFGSCCYMNGHDRPVIATPRLCTR